MSTENDYVRMNLEPDAGDFEAWETRVDQVLNNVYGIGIDFLPDWNSYEAFKNGMSPAKAAKAWVAHSKTF